MNDPYFELRRRVLLYLRARWPRAYRSARDAVAPLRRLWRRMYVRVTRLLFERGGIDTSPLGSRHPGQPESLHYEPSRWTFLTRALRGERIGPEHVFVDVGCGMGRVVLQAARRPFGRVIGMDYSPALIAAAERNLELQRNSLRCPVELVVADVRTYDFPDDVTHVFIYNSVVGETFAAFARKLLESYDRRPRQLRVYYANPREHRTLDRMGRFRRLRRSRRLHADRCIYIYDVVGAPVVGGVPAAVPAGADRHAAVAREPS